MLFDNYSTQAAEASLDALWMKTQVIANNMANADTPGYKAQHVSFEQVLGEATKARAMKADRNNQANVYDPGQAQGGVPTTSGASFRTRVSTQDETSVRVDENNVQLEEQQTELWKSYAQYSYLLDKLSSHYGNINTAISNMRT